MTKDERIISSFFNWAYFHVKLKCICIATIDETLDRLLSSDYSMCRFGDGEFKLLFGGRIDFQNKDIELADRLKEVLCTDQNDNILICIP